MRYGIKNSYNTLDELKVGNKTYHFFNLQRLAQQVGDLSRMPFSLKVLLENVLRHEDGKTVKLADIDAVLQWKEQCHSAAEVAYHPGRVLMQDFTGVPCVVDLAAMRDAIKKLNEDPKKINPLIPVDLVIDHSVQVDEFGITNAYKKNVALEMQRNNERYKLLCWAQQSFKNFRVVPPGTGICHQVNLEYLAKVVFTSEDNNRLYAYPDTLVGTDSHTTMVNGLGVLGWGVGGIEAEAAMLGQGLSMVLPDVIGFQLTGKLPEGITATDLVLTVTQMLRAKGVVGKFVEFYGHGLASLSLADRATIANMTPEFGATCGFFPVDEETIRYLRLTGRDEETIELVKAYCQIQGLWRDQNTIDPLFSDTLTLDLSTVEASVAGPKRPQDRVAIKNVASVMKNTLDAAAKMPQMNDAFKTSDTYIELHHGDVVIAAITSCTNTSNPSVLMAAGLVAKKALEKGLNRKPWVKSSLAPGSQVVTDYLEKAGLQTYLDQLGFNLVGYGCTTCIGNSGPLPDPIAEAITKNDLLVCSVLSGNRNFEGRIHPQVKANWLASPPLVVAYAIAGTMNIDLAHDSLGHDREGKPVYLKDLWPTTQEINECMSVVDGEMFRKRYANVFTGDSIWRDINVAKSETFNWDNDSTYIQNPPYFEHFDIKPIEISEIEGARVLALLGDSITTDHISPAGSIKPESPAGKYLQSLNVAVSDFNSYGSRRGNHQVMMRGTFANVRIRNEMLMDIEGSYTKHFPSHETLSIYDAAMRYQREQIPLVVVAGKEYGTGSSRDWAAKGTALLGVKAVIAESFERIHRSNLIGMGVLPLEFIDGMNRKTLGLTGEERFDLTGFKSHIQPRMMIEATIHYADGRKESVMLRCRIDTQDEINYFINGGILPYVLRYLI